MKLQISTEEKKNVCIFTTFQESDTSYSLNNVVEDQIKMFTDNNYDVSVIAVEGFKPRGEYEKAKKILEIPRVACHNEVRIDDTFDDDVNRIYEALCSIIEGEKIDVFLTHDVIYQPAALKHNIAARKAAKKYPNVKWLHWIHSATSPITLIILRQFFKDEYLNIIQTPFPNSKYVFFNDFSRNRIAKNFNILPSDVVTVYHPIDIGKYLGFHPYTEKLVREKKLFEADAICVYPIRLDRGKQVEYVIKTMAALRYYKKTLKENFSIRIIICDFHSSSNDPQDPKFIYRNELKMLAEKLRLTDLEITFTSEFMPELKSSCPREMVRDLFILSNVYMHPSKSESYSLTTQEAGVCGNVVVLNEDFPPMMDIYGFEPIYRKYSANIDAKTGLDGETTTTYNDEESYHSETASLIAERLVSERSLLFQRKLIKERNHYAVFNNMLRPLL